MAGRGRPRLGFAALFMGAVTIAAAVTLAWALPDTARFVWHAPSDFWWLALLAVLVDVPLFSRAIREQAGIRSTLSVCFAFAVFLQWDTGPAVVVQAAAATVSAAGQRYGPVGGAFFVARHVLALVIADSVVDQVLPGTDIRTGTALGGPHLLPFLLLAGVWLAVNFGLLVLARLTIVGTPPRQTISIVGESLFATTASMLLATPRLTTIGGWWSALVAVPLLIWNMIVRANAKQATRLRREPVSGVLNRSGLTSGLERFTMYDSMRPRARRPFGLVLVNVEAVLTINRVLGREVYEEVLRKLDERHVEAYGADRIGRLAGEGAVVLMPGLTEQTALGAAEESVRLLDAPVTVDGVPFHADPAAGVALSPRDGRDFATLLMKAELAMTDARRSGLSAKVYAHRETAEATRRMEILAELHEVLCDPGRTGEITVLYQPQVDLSTGRLAGAEALVRWTHPEWGPVPPDELIEAIEPSEVMHMLTRHMLDRAADQLRDWDARDFRVRIAVNASARDLHTAAFVDEIDTALRRHRLAADQLTIEITERMLIGDDPRVTRAAERIAALGVGLSIDDFGTGYASLHQLRSLPLTEVKIDRSYIHGMLANPAERAIVASVHQLARALRLAVVAEGVEDEQTATALATLPGTIGQGWHFGRPMTADALERRHATAA